MKPSLGRFFLLQKQLNVAQGTTGRQNLRGINDRYEKFEIAKWKFASPNHVQIVVNPALDLD